MPPTRSVGSLTALLSLDALPVGSGRSGQVRQSACSRCLPQTGDLPAGNDSWSIREYLPAIVNQVLQAMRRDVQGGSVHRIFVAGRCLGALGLQDIVNLVLDGPEFGLGIGFPYPAAQGIQRVQRTIVCEWRDSQQLQARREDCRDPAQKHWRQ